MHFPFYRLAWLALFCAGTAQTAGATIVAAEYYLGSDPGTGNGNPLPLTEGFSLATALPTRSLAITLGPGTHEVGVRVKDHAGRWSTPLLKRFTVHPGNYTLAGGLDRNGPATPGTTTTTPAVGFAAGVTAEYFVGNDPGQGNGNPLPLTEGFSLATALPTRSLAITLGPGTHEVGVRVKDHTGRWSTPLLKRFTVHPENYTLAGGLDRNGPATPGTTTTTPAVGFAAGVTAEYFVGNDPGQGNGNPLPLTEGFSLATALPTRSLAITLGPGTHEVGVRVKDHTGRWSTPLLKRFTVHPGNYTLAGGLDRNGPATPGTTTTTPAVGFAAGVTAEYFVGNDPGQGNGNPLPVSDSTSLTASLSGVSIPQAGMAPGSFRSGVRVRNAAGRWSNPVFRTFTRHASALLTATEAELAAPPPPVTPDTAVAQAWKITMAHQCPVVDSQVVIGGVPVVLEARPGETQQAFLRRLCQAIIGDPRLAQMVTAQMNGSSTIEIIAVQNGAVAADWLTVSAGLALSVTRQGNLGSAGRRIVAAEYFLDLDPGTGLATAAPISLQANDYGAATGSLPISIQALRGGNHRVGLRFKNAAGRWSHPLYRGVNSFQLFGTPDVTPPVLTLTGGASIDLPYGQSYSEPGYTATDETDGNLTATVAVSGQVFPNTPGPHVLRYSTVDKAGNRSERTRTINVQDANAPAITGVALLAYDDPPSSLDIFTGLTAADIESGSLTHRVRHASGSVNWFQSGTYPLIFNVTDAGGNVTSFNRTITLTDRAINYPSFTMWMAGHAADTGTPTEMLHRGADPDADGLSNLEEWNADTNPFDPFSNLQLAFASPTSVWWCGRNRIKYRLESSLNLGTWQSLTGSLNTDTAEDFEVDLSGLADTQKRRFLRLLTEPRMPTLQGP